MLFVFSKNFVVVIVFSCDIFKSNFNQLANIFDDMWATLLKIFVLFSNVHVILTDRLPKSFILKCLFVLMDCEGFALY